MLLKGVILHIFVVDILNFGHNDLLNLELHLQWSIFPSRYGNFFPQNQHILPNLWLRHAHKAI